MADAALGPHAGPFGATALEAPYPIDVDPALVPRGPAIPPLAADVPRPLFSVMIPTYNSTRFLRQTLESVLAQDLGPELMEIEVVDNASIADDPEPLVRHIAGDRVRVFRQPSNLGAVANFNSCIARARGRWVHVLHSDDAVLAGFYEHARRAFLSSPDIDVFTSRHVFIDADDMWMNLSELQARAPGIASEDFIRRQLVAQRLQFVTTVVRRSAYEQLGGFRGVFRHCPDWDMWNRLTLTRRVYYDPEILGCHRLHDGSGTSEVVLSGDNVREERRCLALYCGLLPRRDARRLHRAGMHIAGLRALRHMRRHWRAGRYAPARHQLIQAMRCFLAMAMPTLSYRRGSKSRRPGGRTPVTIGPASPAGH